MDIYDVVKLTSVAVYPLGMTFFLCLVCLVTWIIGMSRVARYIGLFTALWLWVWSMPVTSDRLRAGLEGDYPKLSAEGTPRADAIVILGGAFSHDRAWPYPSAGDSVDRYWHGARLYHAGRAARVVLSGSGNPAQPESLTEAEAGAIFLQDMGVPEHALLLDNASRTTHDHVRYLSEMLKREGLTQLLVVTSATHMRRAAAVFEHAGLEIKPVATGFTVGSEASGRLQRYLPSVVALSGSTRAMHEYIGFWYYRLRGWV